MMPKQISIPHFATDEFARSFLDYGSYVDEHRRILYVETPKAACTSIKQMLRGLLTNEPLRFNASIGESRLAMMIHDRSQMPLPPLTAFSGEKLRDIMIGPGWFRFGVIRHPYHRFFSAWRDKVFLCEPGFEAYSFNDGRKFIEFVDFAAQVAANEDPFTCNTHWRAQVALLLPDDIAYQRIYDLTDVCELSGDLQNHLAKIGLAADVPPLRRSNEGWSIRMDGFLTTNVLTSLRRFYQPDFEWFDCFAECDLTARIPSKASDLVNEFTDAVFDRNRVISEHIRAAREREETRNKQTLRAGTSATDSVQSPIWPGLQYTTLESWINQLEKMVSEKDRELEGLRNSLERAHAEHAITMSTSWRITEPLRRLASWVRSVILERVE